MAGDFQPVPGVAPRADRFYIFLRRYWWVPLITLALSLGGAVSYIILAPPTFVSTARMWETEKMRLPEGEGFTQDLQNYLGTQIELLRSDKLGQMALGRLRGQRTNNIPLNKRGKPLKVRLRVIQAPKTAVLVVEAFSPDPAYTQAYLNALMEDYLDYKKSVRKAVSGDTLASISEQALRLERDLKADQDALTAFQRTNNLAILEEEGRIAGGYLARLKTQLADLALDAQLLEASALEQTLSGAGKTNESGFVLPTLSSSTPSSTSGPAVERQTALRELELLKIQREKLSKFLRPKHPKIVKLDADIERGQKLVEIYGNQSQEDLAVTRRALRMKIDSVQGSIKEWEAKVVDANGRIAEAERLKLNVTRTQSLYDRLAVLLQSVDISRNFDRETLAILEGASPALRSFRQDLLILSLAIAGGLFAGAGLIFLLQFRDDRLSSLMEISERFNDNIVGQVPEIPRLRGKSSLPLLEQDDQRHMYAESYRNLRSALLFLPMEGQRPKIVLITSAMPNEGKSTIAANLARALALGGSRVLLVDADLRKGRLHELMGLRGEVGLAELLCGAENGHSVIQKDSVPNLAFISCGRRSRHPGDLFLRPEMDQLLSNWRRDFDYVVIDSCPLFAADDATALAHKVDGTLLVVRRRFSRAGMVRQAIELLYGRQARVLGLIFNRADASARSYYYYKDGDYAGQAETA